MLGSPKAKSILESAVDGITDLFDEIDQSAPPNLHLQGPAGKAGLSDDDYLDIDDALSTTGKSGVGSALLPSIRLHDLESTPTEDNTSGYNGQAMSCASSGQSEEPSDDIRGASALGGTSHGKSIDVRACRHRITRLQQISQTLSKSPRERSSNHRLNRRLTTAVRAPKSAQSRLVCSPG